MRNTFKRIVLYIRLQKISYCYDDDDDYDDDDLAGFTLFLLRNALRH